jgi:L-lactate dehydrogenase complex protein LldE
LSVLEKLGFDVVYPPDQTCCGQPLANSGYAGETGAINELFVRNFSGFDAVVSPSGSCVLHAKEHIATDLALWEFSQFVGRHLDERLAGREMRSYPFTVGVHQSCHGLRGLRLGTASELMLPASSIVHDLLGRIPGLKFAELDRVDECCGFGGTFAVKEEAVSVRMGEDRIADHERGGAQVVTSADMSCLMHLEGIARRQGQKLVFKHVAEIFDEVL